jgi:hypothetical protein
MNAPPSTITLLLHIVDQAFDTKSWHGTTLRGSLRGLAPEVARWRPAPERHCIWDLVLHTAYWKYIVRRRLTRDTSIRFARTPSNWPTSADPPTTESLKADIRLLADEHQLLREAIVRFPANRLNAKAPESQWTYAEHIHGIAAHDLYHTGQIQLLKRLQRDG